MIHFFSLQRRASLHLQKPSSHSVYEQIVCQSCQRHSLVVILTWLMSATASAALSLGFAFPPSLWTLVMSPPPRLRQDASFLYFTLEPFER